MHKNPKIIKGSIEDIGDGLEQVMPSIVGPLPKFREACFSMALGKILAGHLQGDGSVLIDLSP
jgi:hypothetical protein